jgi:hypothetical protein
MNISNIEKVKTAIKELEKYKSFLTTLDKNYDSKLSITVSSSYNQNSKVYTETTIPFILNKEELIEKIELKLFDLNKTLEAL